MTREEHARRATKAAVISIICSGLSGFILGQIVLGLATAQIVPTLIGSLLLALAFGLATLSVLHVSEYRDAMRRFNDAG